ncbi:hypothetical protein BJ170DRAFT_638232 [Xylariales sp. AK1849]|nr:hypothetical protein BJ170DRAFT_638232 [Xylariales sp. AK1849]
MGSTLSVVKTLIVPALISLLLFLFSTYLLLPLWRQYRQRYSQYLPLDTISSHTSSFRSRVQNTIAKWLIPSEWRMGSMRDRLVTADTDSVSGFDTDDGEELDEVSEEERRRRHALSLDANVVGRGEDSGRRLSRDLEEGFMDDSEEEADNRRRER